jgi:hypothetical protein
MRFNEANCDLARLSPLLPQIPVRSASHSLPSASHQTSLYSHQLPPLRQLFSDHGHLGYTSLASQTDATRVAHSHSVTALVFAKASAVYLLTLLRAWKQAWLLFFQHGDFQS